MGSSEFELRGAAPAPQREAVAAALGLTPAGGSDRFLVSAGVLSLLAAAAEDAPDQTADRDSAQAA
jgi:hypothetical protein